MRRRLFPYGLLAPTLVVLGVGFFVPVFEVFVTAVYSNRIRASEFVGLENFRQIFGDPTFHNALRVSIVYMLGVLAGTLVLGLAGSTLLDSQFRGRGLARSFFLIPWAMPLVSAAFIWKWLLDVQFGVLNYGLMSFGIVGQPGPNWLAPDYALATVIAIQVWKLAPLAIVLYLAGLQNISTDLKEAARIDGASNWRVFRHVTLPGLRSVTIVLTLIIGIWSFGRAFTIIFLLTGGGPVGATENLPLLTYLRAFQFAKFGTASALGVIVFVVAAILALVFVLVTQRGED